MKVVLDNLLEQYSSPDFLSSDPLQLVHEHPSRAPEDREVVALLSALFAYGRVSSIRSFLKQLLDLLGGSPARKLRSFAENPATLNSQELPYYRFQSRSDIGILLIRLGQMIRNAKKSGVLPLEASFGSSRWNTEKRISAFQSSFLQGIPDKEIGPGLIHWIGQSEGNGARKRLCMFLRWMVRTSHPDLGLYKSFCPSRLIIPLDVHMGRIGQNLQLTSRKTRDWKMAEQISLGLEKIAPDDPLKYDFALTRPGILGKCSGAWQERVCPACPLKSICVQAYRNPAADEKLP